MVARRKKPRGFCLTIEAMAEGVQRTPWHPDSTTRARLMQLAGEPVVLRLKEGQIEGVVVYSGREHRRQ